MPFIVRFPRLGEAARARTIVEMMLNFDLLPTLLDFTGEPIDSSMRGKS